MAGILDSFQFDPQSYGSSNPLGWLGMLLNSQPGQSQGYQDQIPPTASPAIGQRGPGVTLPQTADESFGRGPDTSGLGGLLGSLLPGQSGGSPSAPGAGPAVRPLSAGPSPGIQLLNRLQAGATNFTTGGNPIAGLINMVGGLATGQRTDPTGVMLQNQAATAAALYPALVKSGRYSPQEAQGIAIAAAGNPALAAALLPQAFGSKYEAKTTKDALGQESIVAFDPVTGQVKSTGEGGGTSPGGPAMLARGVQKYDPSLTGPDYMAQFGPEVQSIAKAYLNGDQMPTGNPRMQGMLPFAKTVAAKYATDMGIPFSDTLYAAKRQMQTQLASSGNSSMGGIISNGKSAFEHLANYSDKLADLGNVSSNIPLIGGHLATVENYAGNVLTPTSETKAKISAANENGLRYGQESTKFYAGSGGGEAERLMALKSNNPATSSGAEQAAYLQTEKELMLGRLRQKAEQIREVMGDEWVAQHPEKNPFSPDVAKMISKIDANIAKLRGEAPSGTAASAPPSRASQLPQVTTPAEAAKLPKGTHFLDPQGVERIVP